jgi:hypothetical protein
MTNRAAWLRAALANVHADPTWWRTVLRHGALMLSLFGWPLASGLVTENLDNARQGYPTPLPPWVDLGTRYLIGLLSLMVDFVLFVLPAFVTGALFVCVILGTVFGAGAGGERNGVFAAVSTAMVVTLGGLELLIFLSGGAALGRLAYVDDGRIEEAMGAGPLRNALGGPDRGFYMRARLESLPAYVPFVLLALLIRWLVPQPFPGRVVVVALLAWLALSALFYAHLLVVQVYAIAEKEAQTAAMRARMP